MWLGHQVHLLRIYPTVLLTSLQSNRQRANSMQFFCMIEVGKWPEERQVTLSLSFIGVALNSHFLSFYVTFTSSATLVVRTINLRVQRTSLTPVSHKQHIPLNLHQVPWHLKLGHTKALFSP